VELRSYLQRAGDAAFDPDLALGGSGDPLRIFSQVDLPATLRLSILLIAKKLGPKTARRAYPRLP